MAQGKTIVPGMEDLSSGYSRNSNNNDYDNDQFGTHFPGVDFPGVQMNKKPLLGFLFSVSRTSYGEYWPLYQGSNSIGSSNECDIVLKEGTVSSQHAELVVRKMKNSGDVDAAIIDQRSTNGTMVNGESIKISVPRECVNNDVIIIGDHYELLLILIKAKEHGLDLVKDFISDDGQDLVSFDNNTQFGRGDNDSYGASDDSSDYVHGGTKAL